jgi:hypothetical protein
MQKQPDCYDQIVIPKASSNQSSKSPMISPLFNHSQLLPLSPNQKQMKESKSQFLGSSPSLATREFTMKGYKSYSADDLYSGFDY